MKRFEVLKPITITILLSVIMFVLIACNAEHSQPFALLTIEPTQEEGTVTPTDEQASMSETILTPISTTPEPTTIVGEDIREVVTVSTAGSLQVDRLPDISDEPAPLVNTATPLPTLSTQYTLYTNPEQKRDLTQLSLPEKVTSNEIRPVDADVPDLNLPLEVSISPAHTELSGPFPCIEIKFNRLVDESLVTEAITVSPPFEYELVFEPQKVCLKSLEAWQFDREYSIAFDPAVLEPDAEQQPASLTQSYRLAVPTWELNGFYQNPIRYAISFSGRIPLDPSRFDSTFVGITPSLDNPEWELSNENRTVQLTQESAKRLAEGVEYTIRFVRPPIDIYGRTLPLPPEASILVPPPPNFNFDFTVDFGAGAPVEILIPDGRRSIHFRDGLFITEGIDFQLTTISPDEIVDVLRGTKNDNSGNEFLFPEGPDQVDFEWRSTFVEEDGNYINQEAVIPTEVPKGLYILRTKRKFSGTRPSFTVVLTDYLINAKAYKGGVTAWVTDSRGVPAANAKAILYDKFGDVISEAETNEIGVATLPVVDAGRHPMMVMAMIEDEVTIIGLSSNWDNFLVCTREDNRWNEQSAHQSALEIYAISDQPIYRAGSDAYIKGFVRTRGEPGLPAEVEINTVDVNLAQNGFGAIGGAIVSAQIPVDANGIFSGTIPIPEMNARLSEVALRVEAAGAHTTIPIEIGSYTKPNDMTISLSTEHPFYVSGEEIELKISVTDAAGQPPLDKRINLSQGYLNKSDFHNLFDPTHEWRISDHDFTGEPLMLDANGELTVTIPTNRVSSDNRNGEEIRSGKLGLQVEAGNTTRFFTFDLYHHLGRIKLSHAKTVFAPYSPIELTIETEDLYGDSFANLPIVLEFSPSRGGQRTDSSPTLNRTPEPITATTDSNGKAFITLPGFEAGSVELLVQTPANRDGPTLMGAVTTLHIAVEGAMSDFKMLDGLRIAPEQKSYQPGEIATVWVESEFAGPALLTIEGDMVSEAMLLDLTPPYTSVTLPILAEYGPNIFVSITAHRPKAQEEHVSLLSHDVDVHIAKAEIAVPITGKRLEIELTPVESSPSTFKIKVSDEDGNPVMADLSAALTDAGIYPLAEERITLFYEQLYLPREQQLKNFFNAVPERHYFLYGFPCGGGYDYTIFDSAIHDSIYWVPNLMTDENGELLLQLPGTEHQAVWRLTLTALTDQLQVGEAIFYLRSDSDSDSE